jgi:hypothetical protein
MIIGMTCREDLRLYKFAGFISFVDQKRDPGSSKLSVSEQPEARR